VGKTAAERARAYRKRKASGDLSVVELRAVVKALEQRVRALEDRASAPGCVERAPPPDPVAAVRARVAAVEAGHGQVAAVQVVARGTSLPMTGEWEA
jgi:transcription elongation GreA/GreB family factor